MYSNHSATITIDASSDASNSARSDGYSSACTSLDAIVGDVDHHRFLLCTSSSCSSSSAASSSSSGRSSNNNTVQSLHFQEDSNEILVEQVYTFPPVSNSSSSSSQSNSTNAMPSLVSTSPYDMKLALITTSPSTEGGNSEYNTALYKLNGEVSNSEGDGYHSNDDDDADDDDGYLKASSSRSATMMQGASNGGGGSSNSMPLETLSHLTTTTSPMQSLLWSPVAEKKETVIAVSCGGISIYDVGDGNSGSVVEKESKVISEAMKITAGAWDPHHSDRIAQWSALQRALRTHTSTVFEILTGTLIGRTTLLAVERMGWFVFGICASQTQQSRFVEGTSIGLRK
jgi:hypothetical protein